MMNPAKAVNATIDKIQDIVGPKKSCQSLGEGSDLLDYGSWPFIIISVIAVLATAISITSIALHLTSFNKPRQQVYIIAILLICPIYALLSWSAFSIAEGRRADNIIMVRDCYDAVIIFAFYQLLLQYIAPTTGSQKEALQRKPVSWIPLFGPFWKIGYDPASPNFLSTNTIFVIQFVVIKFFMTCASLLFQIHLDNCADATNLKYGNPWYVLAQFVSLPLALYGIVAMYHPFHVEVSQFYAVEKFLAVKGVILFGFLQDMVLLSLYKSGIINLTGDWTLTRIEAFLMVVEMLVLSVLLLFYFSHR
ncbi:organic solute transporter subunit alpha/Transmembrane protein [Obelidium mucronatum]|nr:organic solute transporter subunit alpha/Transmembrane protein [Obelidium mucronatum]